MSNNKVNRADTPETVAENPVTELTMEQIAALAGVDVGQVKVKRTKKARKDPFAANANVPATKVLIRKLLTDFDTVVNRLRQFNSGKIVRGGKTYDISVSKQQIDFMFSHMTKSMNVVEQELRAGGPAAASVEEIPD